MKNAYDFREEEATLPRFNVERITELRRRLDNKAKPDSDDPVVVRGYKMWQDELVWRLGGQPKETWTPEQKASLDVIFETVQKTLPEVPFEKKLLYLFGRTK